jgi:hypothetical protein
VLESEHEAQLLEQGLQEKSVTSKKKPAEQMSQVRLLEQLVQFCGQVTFIDSEQVVLSLLRLKFA